ncbi:hypothetical protein BU14_0116s0018 [Porphyra umbilicalis]|uniref:DJ-1/PfpI domain-containing protein n=1 Tax=Porphyra umbilicalis TaxID=2786 RepID=A0A1X6PBF7_PORUM|nr:hypothetical protein BU14_0116s0018 [Porphyra umbilicalis]|eukprot:OSX78198.1 hypothetical protein BU14_0116s0018 [Porphyra umbilicalis]
MPSVLVPLANGSEELEAVCLVNVLRRCGVDVTLASVETDTLGDAPVIKGSRGTRVVCDVTLAAAGSSWNAIALPGGMPGAQTLSDTPELISRLKEQSAAGKWIGAICAAPFVVLNAHGLLPAAATWYPSIGESVNGTKRGTTRVVVDDGARVVTSQGPATAIEFGLAVAGVVGVDEKAVAKVRDELLVDV